MICPAGEAGTEAGEGLGSSAGKADGREGIGALNYDDISLPVVDGATVTPIRTMVFPGFGPHEVAISQKYHRVYVTQPGQKRVIVIDGRTGFQMPDPRSPR